MSKISIQACSLTLLILKIIHFNYNVNPDNKNFEKKSALLYPYYGDIDLNFSVDIFSDL